MDLNSKEDMGYGLIKNLVIINILKNIKDEQIKKEYLKNLKKQDEEKYNEFKTHYKIKTS